MRIGALVQINGTCRDPSYIGKIGIVLDDYVSWDDARLNRGPAHKILVEEQVLYLYVSELCEFGQPLAEPERC